MRLTHDLGVVRQRIAKALQLDALKKPSGVVRSVKPEPIPERVIVYRTANGFCSMQWEAPVEFRQMLDAQIWAAEMDVQTYFIGSESWRLGFDGGVPIVKNHSDCSAKSRPTRRANDRYILEPAV